MAAPTSVTGPASLLLTILLPGLLLILAPAQPARAQQAIPVTGGEEQVPLVPRTFLLDPDGSLDPAEADRRLAAPGAAVADGTFSHGFIPDTIWARMVVDVAPDAAGAWQFSLALPNYDRLDVFDVPDGGAPRPLFSLGDQVPRVSELPVRIHVAPIELEPGRRVFLVRGWTASSNTLSLALWKVDALLVEEQGFFALQTFYLGVAAVLFLAALALFAYTRHGIYLIYLGNLICHCLIWLQVNGTGPGHFWPELARRVPFEAHVFIALSISTTFAFAAVFLSTARVPSYVRTLLWSLCGVGVVLAVLCLIVPRPQLVWVNFVVSQCTLPLVGFLFLPTIVGLIRGEPAARPLMITWIGLLAAVALGVGRNAGYIPDTPFTLTGPQLGSVFEMLVFGYMLIDRLGKLQNEKDRLQREALAAALEQEALLERRVADRTAALDAANVRLRAIVQSAPFPLALIREADSRILFVNQRACDLVGLPRDAVIGSESRDWFIDPGQRETLLAALAEHGLVEDREVELRRADGVPFWALMSIVRLVYDGEPVRLAALSDITRIKALEHDLRRTADMEGAAAERERAARRLQQQFVAMVSHEFRTPLAIIDGAAQNIAASEPRDRGRVQKIRASVTRLLRMIDTCLVDERVDGGAMVLNRETFDLRELAEAAVDATRTGAPGRPFALDLPTRPIAVTADLRLVEIALNNLLENAVKYSPAGSMITVSVVPRRDDVELSVADEGPGIPASDRDRIFEKYYRAPNTAGTAGAGLGLHLVRAIVDAHGGTVRCLPGSPIGSRFVIRLPARVDPAAPGIDAAPAGSRVGMVPS